MHLNYKKKVRYVLNRDIKGSNFTLGEISLNGKHKCYTLEDKVRKKKIYGETAIWEGVYEIILRKEGGFHERYSERFPDFHEGMLWLQNIRHFQYVYIHIGNFIKDTLGCILTGTNRNKHKGTVSGSKKAYIPLYKEMLGYIKKGYKVEIEIK